MQNAKKLVYTPTELEIIMLERGDILTTSGSDPDPIPGGSGSGTVDDPNIDFDW